MGQNINKLSYVAINGDFIGGNVTNNIFIYAPDSERDFVVTHNASIKPVAYFTGRETELQELRQIIEGECKSILISGMGGIGKTQICRKLFEEYLNIHISGENGFFRHIGYIEYSADMSSSLLNCLKYKEQDSSEKNQEAAWRELEYLASDGKLLLFVDNVDRSMSEDPDLQRLNTIPGTVVLTSRQVFFDDAFVPYRINFLDTKQCIKIYEKILFEGSERKICTDEIPDLEYIIEHLVGKHTITIEHLAHLAWVKNWSVKDLKEKLEEKGFRLQFHKNGELVKIQESYEILYDLSKLTEAEQNILEAFSMFPYIPLEVEKCNEWLLADAEVGEEDDILMGLYQKGWLQHERGVYMLHPVFAQFIYEKCKPKAERHHGLIEACQESLRVPGNGRTLECQKYIPFAECILEKIESEYGRPVGLMDVLAHLLLSIAEYEKAEKWYKKILEYCKDEKNETCIVIIYNNLSALYDKKGDYKQAEEMAQKGLQILRNKAEDFPAERADSYSHLAVAYLRQRRYTDAEEYFEKSLSLYERMETYYNIASSYNSLVYLYKEQERYEEAEKMFGNVVEICEERNLDIGNPNMAVLYDNIAQVYQAQRKYKEAEEYFERSIEKSKSAYGERHPNVAKSYHNLARLYEEQGQYQKALDLFFEAYKIQYSILKMPHPDTETIYKGLEKAYIQCNPKGNFKQWLEENVKE